METLGQQLKARNPSAGTLNNINRRNIMDTETAWDYLIDMGLASEETLRVVTSINGHSLNTLESVLFVVTGYRSFDQLEESN
jgi:hypothetical protein